MPVYLDGTRTRDSRSKPHESLHGQRVYLCSSTDTFLTQTLKKNYCCCCCCCCCCYYYYYYYYYDYYYYYYDYDYDYYYYFGCLF